MTWNFFILSCINDTFVLQFKESYHVLDRIINCEWHTEVVAAVDRILEFVGFYGIYDLDIETKGKLYYKSVSLRKNENHSINIVL